MRSAICLVALFMIFSTSETARCAERDVFMRFTGGGSYLSLANLNKELIVQGTGELEIGYSLSISLGRFFSGRRYCLEAMGDYSRYPYFDYINEFEDFEGQATHYNFMLAGKINLRPEATGFVPYIGAGLGYGWTHIAKSGGKLEGIQGMILLQAESRLTDNISLLVEGAYLASLSIDKYDSAFLEGSVYDGILGSNGEPLEDRFTAVNFRIGFVVWLKQPSKTRMND